MLNPIHGNFKSPNLWKVKVGDIVKKDNGLKFGTTSLTTLKRVELPIITMEQRIIFGILCSMSIYKDEKFAQWGKHWIDGTDRSEAAWAAARAAAKAAAGAAAWAARAAAEAAEATRAARAAREAARAAWAAEWAAAWEAEAARAAWAAEWAARAAAEAAEAAGIDLHKLALKAVSYK